MDVNTKVLDILFRRVSPYKVLSMLRDIWASRDWARGRELFISFAASELDEYSLDELSEIYRKAELDSSIHKERVSGKVPDNVQGELGCSPLSLPELAVHKVLSLSEQMLTLRGTEPLCRIEHVLLWRERYLLLGQDLFVCAYLAQEDIHRKVYRDSFVWPAVLPTDHVQLEKILDHGMAENHQHLYGSSQTFALSWCSVMNYPETHRTLAHNNKFKELFQPFTIRGPEARLVSSVDRVRYACLCRYVLFSWLKIQENEDPREDKHKREEELWEFFDSPNAEFKVSQLLPALRIQFGAKIPQNGRNAECLDYALEEWNYHSAPDAAYRSLAGERYLLYQCFRHFLLGEMNRRMEWLFYLYLILKALFRSELIQVNQQLGFANFSNYQDRKKSLCGRPCYESELLRMAINAPLKEGRVVSLETRIAPEVTAKEDIEWIRHLDQEKQFADLSLEQLQGPYWRKLLSSRNGERHDELPCFFVYHFIKRKDVDAKMLPSFSLTCRHQKLRQTVRAQSIAMTVALSQTEDVSRRVRGIDSASHEIGCPPEVFAPAFRYLRHFQRSRYYEKRLFMKKPKHLLSATYHVGEDFLDIASALRAIDEAVVYLELQRGDRIGHALGLGIDPIKYYELKQRRVYVRKQDRLDDLVWLLFRGLSLNGLKQGLTQKLEVEAYALLNEIYGDVIRKNGWHIDLYKYYESMKLRADEPSYYVTMQFIPPTMYLHQYDEYALRDSDESLIELRKDPSIAGLYYYYHYGREQKIRGSQPLEREISPQYVEMIRDVQRCLQADIAAKGIVIECNPSSNVLIGTFKKYQNHPIFRFCPPFSRNGNNNDYGDMQVCVNTDDLGVFDTSLAFEYALLYQALNEAYDDNGHKRYTEEDILDYLKMLRKAGLAAIFPCAEQNQYAMRRNYYD